MANRSDPRSGVAGYGNATTARGEAFAAGLRRYMLSVYNYMASGVLLTGIVALLFARMRCLFLNVMPRFSKKCQTVALQTESRNSDASCSAIS